jgi:DNA-binding MarR family transcriptional regulator
MTSNLTVSIYQFADHIYALHTEFAHSLGITPIQMLTLNELYKQDGQRASDLALAVGRPATSFTPLLDNLQGAGLIYRKPNKKDRRSVQMWLTDEGKALRTDIVGHMDAVESRISGELMYRLGKQLVKQDFWATLFAPLPEAAPF